MSFSFSGLTARREGVVLYLELTGTLPNPSHSITQLSGSVDFDGKITIDIATRDKGGLSAQVISRVSETLNLGRVGPGTSPYVIVVNGQATKHGQITH